MFRCLSLAVCQSFFRELFLLYALLDDEFPNHKLCSVIGFTSVTPLTMARPVLMINVFGLGGTYTGGCNYVVRNLFVKKLVSWLSKNWTCKTQTDENTKLIYKVSMYLDETLFPTPLHPLTSVGSKISELRIDLTLLQMNHLDINSSHYCCTV